MPEIQEPDGDFVPDAGERTLTVMPLKAAELNEREDNE